MMNRLRATPPHTLGAVIPAWLANSTNRIPADWEFTLAALVRVELGLPSSILQGPPKVSNVSRIARETYSATDLNMIASLIPLVNPRLTRALSFTPVDTVVIGTRASLPTSRTAYDARLFIDKLPTRADFAEKRGPFGKGVYAFPIRAAVNFATLASLPTSPFGFNVPQSH